MSFKNVPLRAFTPLLCCNTGLAENRAREEQEEIQRIKESFLDKVDRVGRQATARMKTMGEQGIAAYQQGRVGSRSRV